MARRASIQSSFSTAFRMAAAVALLAGAAGAYGLAHSYRIVSESLGRLGIVPRLAEELHALSAAEQRYLKSGVADDAEAIRAQAALALGDITRLRDMNSDPAQLGDCQELRDEVGK